MQPRIHLARHAEALKPLRALSAHARGAGLDAGLIELVKLRASQINGCAYCIDMHSKDARALGEDEQRLYLLQAWRESPMYSARERAALAWTEALTQLSPHGVSDEVFAGALAEFGEKGLVDLTIAIVAINGWNRLAMPLRAVPGSYTPAAHGAR